VVLLCSAKFCQILPNSANGVGGIRWKTVKYGGGGIRWRWNTVEVEYGGGGIRWRWNTVEVEYGGGGKRWGWKAVEVGGVKAVGTGGH